jgi:chromosome partitioning protein
MGQPEQLFTALQAATAGQRKGPPMSKRTAIVNQTGDSCKTTTAINLASGYARAFPQKRVLLVDLDPQATATEIVLGVQASITTDKTTIKEVLLESAPVEKAIRRITIEGGSAAFHILPAHVGLALAELALIDEPDRNGRLRAAMMKATDYYDLILMDCPSSLGLLTMNALTYATKVIIPVAPQVYPLPRLAILEDLIDQARQAGNVSLTIRAIVPTLQSGAVLSTETERMLIEQYGELVYPGVPWHQPGEHMPGPDSPVTAAYRRLVQLLA